MASASCRLSGAPSRGVPGVEESSCRKSSRTPDLPLAEARPLSFWLERYPPGWISSQFATEADPVQIAARIAVLAAAFAQWLQLPRSRRWDDFGLQTLSAALFNRYRDFATTAERRTGAIGLLQLDWPPGSEAIQSEVAALQTLLAPPLAVFKAVRIATGKADFPTSGELESALAALAAGQAAFNAVIRQLHEALQKYGPPALASSTLDRSPATSGVLAATVLPPEGAKGTVTNSPRNTP